MELKEKLRQILKERYGIENDAEIIKEANLMQDLFISLLVSIIAGVISYYICKWLDGDE